MTIWTVVYYAQATTAILFSALVDAAVLYAIVWFVRQIARLGHQ